LAGALVGVEAQDVRTCFPLRPVPLETVLIQASNLYTSPPPSVPHLLVVVPTFSKPVESSYCCPTIAFASGQAI